MNDNTGRLEEGQPVSEKLLPCDRPAVHHSSFIIFRLRFPSLVGLDLRRFSFLYRERDRRLAALVALEVLDRKPQRVGSRRICFGSRRR